MTGAELGQGAEWVKLLAAIFDGCGNMEKALQRMSGHVGGGTQVCIQDARESIFRLRVDIHAVDRALQRERENKA